MNILERCRRLISPISHLVVRRNKSVATKNSPTDDGPAGQKEQSAPRCERRFELSGDHVQCLLPAAHEGNHSFELPPLWGERLESGGELSG